jgi:hypothetical protein
MSGQDSSGFECATCGESHDGLPTDRGFTLPDEVWAIPEEERGERAKFDSDLCRLGERYFFRGVLFVPFNEQAGEFGWGVWVEVSEDAFQRYVALYDADGRSEPPVSGTIANDIPTYPATLGLPVRVQFQTSSSRPIFLLAEDNEHPLAVEQAKGMSHRRYHEILAVG